MHGEIRDRGPQQVRGSGGKGGGTEVNRILCICA